jgi:hypothetical protein
MCSAATLRADTDFFVEVGKQNYFIGRARA